MTETSLYDDVVDELIERQRLVKAELQKRFKKTKPFRMEPVKDEDLLYDYNTKGFEIFSQLADTQGIEVAIQYRDEMERLKAKMGGI